MVPFWTEWASSVRTTCPTGQLAAMSSRMDTKLSSANRPTAAASPAWFTRSLPRTVASSTAWAILPRMRAAPTGPAFEEREASSGPLANRLLTSVNAAR